MNCVTTDSLATLADYQLWLHTIKQRVVSARLRVALAANRELIQFYWELGAQIAEKQAPSQCGDKLIPQLSADLQKAFTELKGLSASNLKYCLRFYQFYANPAATPFGQQAVDQIPWGHNVPRWKRQLVENCQVFNIELWNQSFPKWPAARIQVDGAEGQTRRRA